MSAGCEELDSFFDGELSKDEAGAFRAHLVTCEPCQGALCGRAQEELVVQSAHEREERPRVFAIESAHRPMHRGRAVALAGMLAAALVIWLVATRSDERARQITTHEQVAMHGEVARHGREEATSLERPLELVSSIEHRVSGMRGSTMRTTLAHSGDVLQTTLAHSGDVLQTTLAHSGDALRLTIHGERHRALWIYLGARELVAMCPGDPRCVASDSGLSLDFPLEAVGQYWIIALGLSEPIIVPTGRFDTMLSAATSAGARFAMTVVTVN